MRRKGNTLRCLVLAALCTFCFYGVAHIVRAAGRLGVCHCWLLVENAGIERISVGHTPENRIVAVRFGTLLA